MPTALVTGATAGIGNAFARLLAARGHDLVLVARDVDRLESTAADLRATARVHVEVLPADLTDRAALEKVADRLRDASRPVDVLVNNAGFSTPERFVGSDLATQEAQLDVLVRAVLVLSHAAAPGMRERRRGRVVTISSVAGFLWAGTYSAAKAWATTFTASLAAELNGTGVTATAVCPGFVKTEFHARMGIRRQGPDWAWLDADWLVARAWADVEAARVVSVPSRRYTAAVAFLRHLPLRGAERLGNRYAGNRASARTRPGAASR